MGIDVRRVRSHYPGLERSVRGRPAMFLDGPAGTQVPASVAEAVAQYLLQKNANHGGFFATSRESDAMLDEARAAAADFFGVDDPQAIVFGPNMTTITFQMSRAIACTWNAGDEVVVSDSDHDANVTPWVLAARDRGAIVRRIRMRPEDTTLDLDDLRAKLSSRTKLVAVGAVSNASGTIHPVEKIAALAHEVGALVYVDAVHYAPHAVMDVRRWNADFVVASAYKFFGPHAAILWGRRALLDSLPAYKVRPAGDLSPDRWMTGTPAAENIAGTLAAIEYLASLGEQGGSERLTRRERIVRSMSEIAVYERSLAERLIGGLVDLGIRVWGIVDTGRFGERVPTVSITHPRHSSERLARALADEGIFVWHGNFYAQPFHESLRESRPNEMTDPTGMVRIGLVHYNTAEEVDRLLDTLKAM